MINSSIRLLTDAIPQWLEADIKQGISNTEVENRRKKTGFNELVSTRSVPSVTRSMLTDL